MPAQKSELLFEIHAIQQLKYRYMRALDTHNWDLMAGCLAEDASSWYSNGLYTFEGRDKILEFLRSTVGSSFFSSHIALHPEITLTAQTTAKGIWRMQDVVHFTATNQAVRETNITGGEKLEGAAYYYDEYRKVGADWLIQSTGYVRIFESFTRPDYSGDQHLMTEPLLGMRAPSPQ